MIFQRLAAPFISMLHFEKNHQICQKIEKKLVPYRLKKITAIPKTKNPGFGYLAKSITKYYIYYLVATKLYFVYDLLFQGIEYKVLVIHSIAAYSDLKSNLKNLSISIFYQELGFMSTIVTINVKYIRKFRTRSFILWEMGFQIILIVLKYMYSQTSIQ